MQLRTLTNGAISGTGTLSTDTYVIGGVLITTDNSNAVTVVIRRNDSNGKPIFDITTSTTIFVGAPISTEQARKVHYSVTGTGGEAQLYEWVE